MEDLLRQLQEKAGLTEEQAVKAVYLMKDYILGKVPPMFSGFVENFFVEKSNKQEDDPLA